MHVRESGVRQSLEKVEGKGPKVEGKGPAQGPDGDITQTETDDLPISDTAPSPNEPHIAPSFSKGKKNHSFYKATYI